MIQSVNQSGDLSIYYQSDTSIKGTNQIKGQASEPANTAQTGVENANISKDGDVVTISTEALEQYNSSVTTSSQASQAVAAQAASSASTADLVAQAAASIGITEATATESELNSTAAAVETSSSSSSSSSTSSTSGSLAQYSELQLKQMVSEGTISTQQYNAEMASRKDKESTTSSIDLTV